MQDTFGVRLMKAQSRAEMRTNALARATGTSSSTISGLRLDKRDPSREMLTKLCQVLNVSADFLLGLSDKPRLK
jgi:transcriptional regulator with XRE-family HTH domain